MALEKKTEIDKVEIVGQYKAVQVRQASWVEEDGVMIGGKSYHRWVVSAGDDYSNEEAEVQAVCAAVHTDEVKAAYAAFLEAQSAELAE